MIVVVGFSDLANAGSFRPHERSMGDFFYALEPFCQFFFIKQKDAPRCQRFMEQIFKFECINILPKPLSLMLPIIHKTFKKQLLGKGALLPRLKTNLLSSPRLINFNSQRGEPISSSLRLDELLAQ